MLRSPQSITMVRVLMESFLLFLFSCIILRPCHRTLGRAADVIAAVHYLNVLGIVTHYVHPAIYLFIYLLLQLLLIISKSFTRLYLGYI